MRSLRGGFYYAMYHGFNLTNSDCGQFGELLGMVRHSLNDAFKAAKTPVPPVATDAYGCSSMMPDVSHDRVFTFINYVAAKDRSLMQMSIEEFVEATEKVLGDSDFPTILQHAIEEAGILTHEGSIVELSTDTPKIIGFIILEGPPGSAAKLQKSNGPVF